MTKISQWISSYRSSSTLLSIEPDAGEASNCCWCLCNCPWSLVTRSSNKLWTNNKVALLFLNCFGKARLFLCDCFIDLHSWLFFFVPTLWEEVCSALQQSSPACLRWPTGHRTGLCHLPAAHLFLLLPERPHHWQSLVISTKLEATS